MVMTSESPTTQQTAKTGYFTQMPVLHEDQICPSVGLEEFDPDAYGADVDEPLIWGLSGVRGSGKSMTLCFFGIKTMAIDMPVWSNFPIKYQLLSHHKPSQIKESYPLYFKDLFAIDPKFTGGMIIIDEYQDWANSYAFMTTQNKLLNSFWAQIRKNELSFAYAAKKLRWIDLKTREETDIEIACRDAHKTREGRRQYTKGEMVYWKIRDLSGNWTGMSYEDTGIEYENKFAAQFIWGAYDTRQRFDIFEAMRGVKMDLEKVVISDKEEQFNKELLEQQLLALFRENQRWKSTELYYTLGITVPIQKTAISRLVKDMGGKEVYKGNSRFLELNVNTDYKE
jgi:hypothetical protein